MVDCTLSIELYRVENGVIYRRKFKHGVAILVERRGARCSQMNCHHLCKNIYKNSDSVLVSDFNEISPNPQVNKLFWMKHLNTIYKIKPATFY